MTYDFGTKWYAEINGELYWLAASGRFKQSESRAKIIRKKGIKNSEGVSNFLLSTFAHTPIFN